MTILVTGGAGSIGSAVVRRLLEDEKFAQESIRVFSRNDSSQHFLRQSLTDEEQARCRFILGDVRDRLAVARAIHGVRLVFHCAALKHVANCEYNAAEIAGVNIHGTTNLLGALHEQDEEARFVLLSTDKAAGPVNVMGASKLVAEHIVMGAQWSHVKRAVTRFGNVWNSKGSVLPTFIESIKKFGRIRVTDMGCTRYLLTIDGAVDTMIEAATVGYVSSTKPIMVIPKMRAVGIEDIIEVTSRLVAGVKFDIEIIGLPSTEKRHEQLITVQEAARVEAMDDRFLYLSNDRSKVGWIGLEPWFSSENALRVSVDDLYAAC